jgi:hypothetical protein
VTKSPDKWQWQVWTGWLLLQKKMILQASPGPSPLLKEMIPIVYAKDYEL